MSEQIHNLDSYEFGAFRLDVAERVLTKGSLAIPLTPKAFDTLVVLVRNSGHVVSKDELLKAVWPDTFVEEGVLAVNVAVLRKALNDGEEGRTYIETVPRRGYRFVGQVKRTGKGSEDHRNESRVTWVGSLVLLTLALIGTGWYLSRSRSISVTPPSLPIPLTAYPGTELSPTFSPDGSQVAFSWDGNHQDNFDIYVKLIDRADAVRLTRDSARDMSPAWSPDGRSIAFAREGAVYLIPPTGGAETKVADVRAVDIDWTRDSKSLVISAGTFKDCRLLLLSVDSGQIKELTSPPGGQEFAFGDFNVAVSPDGLTLAFVRAHTSSSSDLYLMPLTGGEPQRLTRNEGPIRGVTWTGDGREIVYASRTGPTGSYLARRSTEDRPESTSKRVEGVELGRIAGPVISHPALGSPIRLAYERIALDTNIWVKDAQDSSAPIRKLIASTRFDDNPQFSPDGSRIAFVSGGFGRHGIEQIWVANRDGSKPLQLTSFSTGATNAPRWAPNGKSIVFASMQNGNRDLYSVSPDGSSFCRLTSEPSEEGRPSWSRDGHWIYCYSNRTGHLEIWKIPGDGGEALQVTKGGGHESFESPDGKLLYYEDFGVKGLHTISTENSSGPREGTVVLSSVRPGFWAVCEKGIYFVEFDDQHAASQFVYYNFVVGASNVSQPIKFYDFKTQKISQIGSIEKGVIRQAPSFSVTWDGRYIAWAQVDQGESDLMMIENFR